MGEAARSVLSQFATFTGRASRSDYWWWVLAYVLALFAIGLVDTFVIAPSLGFNITDENAGQPLSMLFVLAMFLPNLAVSVRRLHDLNKSGWWLLLGLLPVVGVLVLLYWIIQSGTEGSNEFGSDPQPQPSS